MNVFILAVVAVAAILGIIVAVTTAPRGYQDEDGFHYGDPPEK
jgi:hypothetical protein